MMLEAIRVLMLDLLALTLLQRRLQETSNLDQALVLGVMANECVGMLEA